MVGFYAGDPVDSLTLRAQGTDLMPASAGDVLAATAGGALASNPTPRLLSASGEQINQGNAVDEFGRRLDVGPAPTMLAPDEANARFGIKSSLSFDKPVTEETARSLHDAHHDEQVRADTLARSAGAFGSGMVARGITGFAMGLLDPLNLAAGLVPGLGEVRAAALLGGAGGQLGARALAGATAGAAGMAALEPLNFALDQREHNDWSATQALLNIGFGSVLGGGLHVLGGAAGDVLRARNPITRGMEAATPETRDMALRGSLAAVAEGRPVDVAPALDLVARSEPPISSRRVPPPDVAAGNYAAYAPNGMRVELKPEIVEAADLVTSHAEDGTVNPDYPHAEGLQPRDRTAVASEAHIAEIASKFVPDHLAPQPSAASGPPIVNESGAVESGNGRTLALRRIYSSPDLAPHAEAYKAMLRSMGHDVEGFGQPVLIGRRQTSMTAEQLRQFTSSANERTTLGLSAAETARMDATRAGRAVAQFQVGPIDGRANTEFVRAFMAQVPAEERAGMILGDGRLSAPGIQRIRSALLAHAYGDAIGPTLDRLLNGDSEGMKAVAGALQDTAPRWGQLRTAAADGSIPAGLDISAPLGEAVQVLDRARALGKSVPELLAQSDLVGAPSDAAQGLLRLFYTDDSMRQLLPRARLTELLDRYVTQALEAHPGPDMFGTPETSAADIIRSLGGGQDAMDRAAAALQSAPSELAARAAETAYATIDRAERAANADAVARAPSVPAERPKALAEAQAAADHATAQVESEIGAGRLTEAQAAELRAVDAIAEANESEARAIEAAAACLVTGG